MAQFMSARFCSIQTVYPKPKFVLETEEMKLFNVTRAVLTCISSPSKKLFYLFKMFVINW